jgi:mitogen-activated protein kinase kinase kinase 1
VSASWSSTSSSAERSAERSPGVRPSRSLDLAARDGGTDFRISGSAEGEVDELCRSLGLSGPEDFAIPVAAWEARKARSSNDLLSSRADKPSPPPPPPGEDAVPILRTTSAPEAPWPAPVSFPDPIPEESVHSSSTSTAAGSVDEPTVPAPVESPNKATTPTVSIAASVAGLSLLSPRRGSGEAGIRGVRPPVLSPPPPITGLALPPVRRSSNAEIMAGSAWDIVNSFAPREDNSDLRISYEHVESPHMSDTEETDEGFAGAEGELKGWRVGETFEGFTGTSSLSTTNDDDASSTNTEPVFNISPNGKFKRNIKSWMRGALLGSGSFGTVYEGISE